MSCNRRHVSHMPEQVLFKNFIFIDLLFGQLIGCDQANKRQLLSFRTILLRAFYWNFQKHALINRDCLNGWKVFSYLKKTYRFYVYIKNVCCCFRSKNKLLKFFFVGSSTAKVCDQIDKCYKSDYIVKTKCMPFNRLSSSIFLSIGCINSSFIYFQWDFKCVSLLPISFFFLFCIVMKATAIP